MKLTINYLHKLINEHLQLEDDNNPAAEPTQTNISVDEAIALLPINISNRIQGMDPKTLVKAKSALEKAIRTGRSVYDYNLYSSNNDMFQFLTDAMAALYKELGNNQNLRSALMEFFSPYGKVSDANGQTQLSNFGNKLVLMLSRGANNGNSNAGHSIMMQNNNLAENIIEAMFGEGAFDYALNNYDSNKSFNSFLSTIIKNKVIDLWRKENQYQEKGEKQIRQFNSIDKNVDDEDPDAGKVSDIMTSDDLGNSSERYNQLAKRIYPEFIKFIIKQLSHDSIVSSIEGNPMMQIAYDYYLKDKKNNTDTPNSVIANHISEELDKQVSEEQVLDLRKKVLDKVISTMVNTILFESYVKDGGDGNYDISSKDIAAKIESQTGRIISEKDVNVYKSRLIEKITQILKSGMMDRHIYKTTGDRVDFAGIVKGKFPLEACRYEFFLQHIVKHLNEMKKVEDAKTIISEMKNKLEKMNKVYNNILSFNNKLNEVHDIPGKEVQTADLYQMVKEYVDNCLYSIQGGVDYNPADDSTLLHNLYKVLSVSKEIKFDYPGLAEELYNDVHPMIEQIYAYPEKLKNIVRKIKNNYNSKPYGL